MKFDEWWREQKKVANADELCRIEAQIAWSSALEEAAKVAEEYKGYTHDDGATICDNLFSLADEIRQLKTKE